MRFRKLRIAWSIACAIACVLLIVSCRQKAPQKAPPIPHDYTPGPRNVDWKESLAETLPTLADISKITLTSPLTQPLTVSSKDWPKLLSVLDESEPGASGTTIPVMGIVEIAKRDGQSIRVSIYYVDEKDVVYQFHSEGDARSGREYYSSGGTAKISNLFPAIRINLTAGPQTPYALHYSILVIVLLALVVAAWRRPRFSLRSLLIATTLVAVVLGLAVYLVRTH